MGRKQPNPPPPLKYIEGCRIIYSLNNVNTGPTISIEEIQKRCGEFLHETAPISQKAWDNLQTGENEMSVEKHLELLGMKVKDKVSGFEGVVSTLSFDLYG